MSQLIDGKEDSFMKNQFKWGIVLSYVSTGLNMIIQLIYTPVMIRLLGQSEYGLYTLVGSIVSYLSLFSLGFTGAYLRFYSRYKVDNKKTEIAKLNGMFMTIFVCMGIVALICGITLSRFPVQLFGTQLLYQEMKKAEELMQILVINIALTFPSSVFDSIISANEQFIFHRILTLLGTLFNPLICLPLLLLGYGSVAVVTVTTIITIIKLLVSAWFCVKKLAVKFLFSGFDFGLLKEISSFSFFLFLNMLIDQINWSIDKLILGRLAGTSSVAIYSVGAQINALFITFSTAVSSVFAPRVNQIAAEKSEAMKEKMTTLFIKVGRIQFIILSLVASGFLIFGHYFVMEIYAGIEYSESYVVAMVLILPSMIPLIQNIGIEIQRAINKHRVRAIIYTMMAFANIGISIPLAMLYGPIGSAIGTAISLLVANGFIMNVYYQKAIKINIIEFWESILSLSKGLVFPGIIGFFIMSYINFASIGSFVIWVIFYIVIYLLSMWLFGMNNFEKNLIHQPMKRIYEKRK